MKVFVGIIIMVAIWLVGETGPALDKEAAYQDSIVNKTLSKEDRETVVLQGENYGYQEDK